jgi:type II secretory pathway pseudopilin PulG
MKRAGGMTLVEIIVVLTVGTVLLGIAVGLLDALMQMEGAARQRARTTAMLAELCRQFRDDAHAASGAVPGSDPGGSLVLRMPSGQTIVYRIESGKITRGEEGPAASGREDEFPLVQHAAKATLDVRAGPQGGAGVTVLVIPLSNPAAAPLRVEAVVSRAHRFEEPLK